MRGPAIGLGVAYLVAVATLGPLLGSTADSSTAFTDHFSSGTNRRNDLLATVLLLIVAGLVVWTIEVARDAASGDPAFDRASRVSGSLSTIGAGGLVVAAGLLATVPLTSSIGEITDDPGLEPAVQAGVAQAGTVVLLMSMLVVGAAFILAVRIGAAVGAVGRWAVVTSWLVATTLILGVSLALLFPFGFWVMALGLTWKHPTFADQP